MEIIKNKNKNLKNEISNIDNMGVKYTSFIKNKESPKIVLPTRMSKTNIIALKKKLGTSKVNKIVFNHKHPNMNYTTPKYIVDKHINDLCDKIKQATLGEIPLIRSDINGALTHVQRTLERRKNKFKDKRWKRAQAGIEYTLRTDETILTLEGRTKKIDQFEHKVVVQLRHVPILINFQEILNGMSNLDQNTWLLLMDAKIADLEFMPEESSMPNAKFNAIDFINSFKCPHCFDDHRCRTCLLEKKKLGINNHSLRVIEDIVIAFIQIYTYRDAQIFFFEMVRIIKTIFGVAIVGLDFIDVVSSIIHLVATMADLSGDLMTYARNVFDINSAYTFFTKLFEEKQAQGLSDWMETDLFRYTSNWFSYLCYLSLSRGKCSNLPFIGDLMRATLEDGRRVSKDILKFTIKTIEFILTKGRQALEFGFVTTFYHSKATMIDLAKRYDDVCTKYLCKGNPSVYKLDYHKFVNDLQKLKIELSELSRIGTVTVREKINTMLAQVIRMLNDVQSDAEILKTRKAPFSLLVWGKTAIAKSTFLELTSKILCDVHSKEYAPEYIYTMNDDERLDGYKSHMHTMIMDDIGNKHPNVCPNGDAMVNMIIKVVNNVAAISEQAVAEAKGNIPIMVDFLLLTANTEHVNAQYYLTYPAALMRRFNYIIQLQLKDKYAINGMFDAEKVDIDEDTFDFWDMIIGKFVPDDDQSRGSVVYSTKITSIDEYFEWLAKVSRKHVQHQELRMASINKFTQFKVCRLGHRSEVCDCQEIDKLNLKPAKTVFGETIYQKSNVLRCAKKAQGGWDMIRTLLPIGMCDDVLNNIWNCKLDIPGVLLHTVYHSSSFSANVGSVICNSANKVLHYGENIRKISRSVSIATKTGINLRECTTSIGKSPLYAIFNAAAEQSFPNEWDPKDFILKLSALIASIYFAKKLFQKGSEAEEVRRLPQGNIEVKHASEFWVDKTNILKDADVGASSLFYKNKRELFLQRVANNTVMLICETDRGTFIDIRALCLGGFTYVTNYHYVKHRRIVRVQLIQDNVEIANSNIMFNYSFKDAKIDESNDLIYFKITDNKPKKNLSNMFYQGDLSDTILMGCYLERTKKGSIIQHPVDKIHPTYETVLFQDGDRRNISTFNSIVDEPTVYGDCGMPLIAFTAFGPVICGLHITGLDKSCAAVKLGFHDIRRMNVDLSPDLSPPKLVFDSASKVLVPERLISHPNFLPHTNTVMRYGTIVGGGSRSKSGVVVTDMADEFKLCGYEQLKDKPPMDNYRIFSKNLNEMTSKVSLVDEELLENCTNRYYEHIISTVNDDEFKDLGTISLNDNINGMQGVDYIDKINRNTSMGFPWNKTTKRFLTHYSTEDHPDGVLFSEEVIEEFHRQDYLSRTAIMAHPIYNVSQKDEPLPKEKCVNWGTRLFMGAPKPTSLVNRKYHLTIIRLFQRNRLETRTAIGTVVQSKQWGELVKFLPWHDRIVAGDYSKFDKKQQIRILQGACDVLYRLARYSNKYTDIDLTSIKTQHQDIIFALVNFDGDLMAFFGCLPSGNSMTTLLNCICNILLDMYAYQSAGNLIQSYFEDVVTIVYGDDSITSISPRCGSYNHTIKRDELAKIGIVFTMADKNAESIPFIHLEDASFLKRSFVYNEEDDIWCAPLEESNIINALMIWVESKNLTKSEQAWAAMQSSIREFFFHGRSKFDKMGILYKDIYLKVYGREIIFPHYDDVLSVFRNYGICKLAQSEYEYDLSSSRNDSMEEDILYRNRSYFTQWDALSVQPPCLSITYPIYLESLVMPYVHSIYYVKVKDVEKVLRDLSVFDRYVVNNIMNYTYRKCFCCDVIACSHKLCFNHKLKFNHMYLYRFKRLYRRMCYGCGIFYDNRVLNGNNELCLVCISKYVCRLCTVEALCIRHLWCSQHYKEVDDGKISNVVFNIFPDDLIFNISKREFFRNYHLYNNNIMLL
jgi:hypothetical protein